MDIGAACEIIECLPKGRTLFHYFPDRYAVYLLQRFIGDGCPISRVGASRFAKLLQRPAIRRIIAAKGDGRLSPDDFAQCWAVPPETYLLTLGLWGPENPRDWSRYHHQMSRPGVNLVLQLNFSERHNELYRRFIRAGDRGPFEHTPHPIARHGFHTLAWARLDVDLERDEALIEEVQTDWLRLASGARLRVEQVIADRRTRENIEDFYFGGHKLDPEAMRTYFDDVLMRHIPIWDEALLTAVIDFLFTEIGLRRIWYHDFDCGRRLKGIEGRGPPRGIYSKLPQRFCFETTCKAPRFLLDKPSKTVKSVQRACQMRFWRLDA